MFLNYVRTTQKLRKPLDVDMDIIGHVIYAIDGDGYQRRAW